MTGLDTASSAMEVCPNGDDLVSPTQDLTLEEESPKPAPVEVPAHRSHDPDNNKKRSDPFQFGSRYLGTQDDVFEFNAWDHVETDDAYKEYAQTQYEKQRQAPASDFDKSEFAFFFFSFFAPLSGHLLYSCSAFRPAVW